MSISRFGNNCRDFLKPLVRYPITLFILLLIGYSQLFAPLFRDAAVYSPIRICQTVPHYQSPPLKGDDKETIYIEEEEDDERGSGKKNSEECSPSILIYAPSYFTQQLKSGLLSYKSFSHSALARSPFLIFCVFRL